MNLVAVNDIMSKTPDSPGVWVTYIVGLRMLREQRRIDEALFARRGMELFLLGERNGWEYISLVDHRPLIPQAYLQAFS